MKLLLDVNLLVGFAAGIINLTNQTPIAGSVGHEPCSRVHQRLFTVHSSQKKFRNELGVNSPGEHFFISQKGGGAEGAAPFFDL